MKIKTTLAAFVLGCIGYSQYGEIENRSFLSPNTKPPLVVAEDNNDLEIAVTTKYDSARAQENHVIRDYFHGLAARHPYIVGSFYMMRDLCSIARPTGVGGELINADDLLNKNSSEQINFKTAPRGDDSTSLITISRKGLQDLVDYNDSLQKAHHLEPRAPLYILDNVVDAIDVHNAEANAQAGNGKVGITFPMLKNYKTRELKSVIGHELAHEFYQNQLTMLFQSAPEMEHEADSIGIILTNDPYGSIQSHKKDLILMKEHGRNDNHAITHPTTASRIEFSEKEWRRLTRKFAL